MTEGELENHTLARRGVAASDEVNRWVSRGPPHTTCMEPRCHLTARSRIGRQGGNLEPLELQQGLRSERRMPAGGQT
jgi:hypothetical protein